MEGSPCEGEEAAKDPAAKQPPLDHEVSYDEISSHRHHYVGFHVPGKKTHGGHRKGSVASGASHRAHARNKHLKLPKEELRPGDPFYGQLFFKNISDTAPLYPPTTVKLYLLSISV